MNNHFYQKYLKYKQKYLYLLNQIGSATEPFYNNIEQTTISNTHYRNILYTSKSQQIVVMSIKPNDNIHKEIHKDHDQFIRIEKGVGKAIIDDKEYQLLDGIALIIPAGTTHEIINTSNTEDLKLYTIYSPPEHKENLVQHDKPLDDL